MEISKPIGEIRYNPNTMMQEVWDGKDWNQIDDPNNFVTIPIHGGIVSPNTTINIAPYTGTTTYGVNGSTYHPGTSHPSITEKRSEELYEFLKDNLRVAEYMDENGKVDYVQLELRAGEGYLWESIQRIRIKP